LLSSCVDRLLKIRTEPAGASVLVNGELVMATKDGKEVPATTPIDVPFDFYGTFEVEVRRESHLSQRKLVPVSAPWYSYPPIDFFAEVLWPWQIESHHPIEIKLEPVPERAPRQDAIYERRDTLRSRLDPSKEADLQSTNEGNS
jgi:hypothetical protein